MPYNPGDIVTSNDKTFYPTIAENWFSAKPYGFKITLSNNKSFTVFLPISPSNLTISTKFATNMVPTLYGTVEEHSDVRYFDISIQGTTGFAPQYISPFESRSTEPKSMGRGSFPLNKSIPLGGFFSKTVSALKDIKTKALDAIDGSDKPNETGISASNSGYVAFHNLYKMLLRYKKDASGAPSNGSPAIKNLASRKTHPIVFFNFKDGNQYNVVISDFTMSRSAENPMLYNYTISMRGYSLTTNGLAPPKETKKLESLGLNGVEGSSLLGDIKKRANSVKSVLSSAAGGINTLGR